MKYLELWKRAIVGEERRGSGVTERDGRETEGAKLICIGTCISALDEFSARLRSNWSSFEKMVVVEQLVLFQ